MNSFPPKASNPVPSDAKNGPVAPDLQPLIRRAVAGDEEAFGEVVKAHYQSVYAVIYRMVHNVEDARELTQQAWVKAWQRLSSYHFDAKFTTWIYRIAVNTALDFIRKRARQKETVYLDEITDADEAHREALQTVDPAPETGMDRDAFREAFHAALEELTPEHRQALMLREVEGLSYKEIAGVMDCRIGTVMSRIFYARRLIQKKLGDWR